MKNAILIHGYCKKQWYMSEQNPAMSEDHWFPWLKSELCKKGILTANPEFPKPWMPDYKTWKAEFERHQIDKNTILIGHSYGAGFLAHWLSETDKKVGKVILVAPFMGVGLEKDFPPEIFEKYDFFKFKISPRDAEKTQKGLTIIKSTNDRPDVNQSVEILMKDLGDSAKLIELENRGHFFSREKWTKFEFPELLEEALK